MCRSPLQVASLCHPRRGGVPASVTLREERVSMTRTGEGARCLSPSRGVLTQARAARHHQSCEQTIARKMSSAVSVNNGAKRAWHVETEVNAFSVQPQMTRFASQSKMDCLRRYPE